MTFAACVECLTQLKPPRETVVPAIIRKADKMGWLRNDNDGDNSLIGDCLIQFLPNKQRQAWVQGMNLPTPLSYPCPPPVMPPAPAISNAPPCVIPPPPVPCVSFPVPQQVAPSLGMANPVCTPPCPCPSVTGCPATPCPVPSYQAVAPMCSAVQIASVAQAPAQDKLTTELLKILEETESKTTFAIIVATLNERLENWDAVIPTVIRKADKMGWLRAGDKDCGDQFTRDLAELITGKARKADKVGCCDQTPCEAGCTCPKSTAQPTEATLRMRVLVNPYDASGFGTECVGGQLRFERVDGGAQGEYLYVVPCHGGEVLPMPRTEEVLPMPHIDTEPMSFDFFNWTLNY
jgi:hypothetical protein